MVRAVQFVGLFDPSLEMVYYRKGYDLQIVVLSGGWEGHI